MTVVPPNLSKMTPPLYFKILGVPTAVQKGLIATMEFIRVSA
jgi:hypothetical protein